MKVMRLVTIVAMIAAVTLGMAIAQAPPAGGQGGQGRGAPGAWRPSRRRRTRWRPGGSALDVASVAQRSTSPAQPGRTAVRFP
jgi:hypothetical protein